MPLAESFRITAAPQPTTLRCDLAQHRSITAYHTAIQPGTNNLEPRTLGEQHSIAMRAGTNKTGLYVAHFTAILRKHRSWCSGPCFEEHCHQDTTHVFQESLLLGFYLDKRMLHGT